MRYILWTYLINVYTLQCFQVNEHFLYESHKNCLELLGLWILPII